ncbi:MAG: prolipoprotein diacylglyceryl transferase [Pseudomonadota bacterium]|nr:prolipoprotein diacylglyceryl transferase [Pseudomonadota bacterium]
MLTFPDIDPVAFSVGPLHIRWYALAYLAGFVLGWMYTVYLSRLKPLQRPVKEELDDFLSWAVIGVILGGRLGYILFYNFSWYLDHPVDILKVWQGGMSFHGGLAGILAAILLFSRKRKLDPFHLGDLIACAGPIGFFFGRVANFINGELYGRATDVPWAMVFPHGGLQFRHPSQLYEAALEGLLLFAILAMLAHRQTIRSRPGFLAGVFFAGYSLARIVVEFFREPDTQLGYLWAGATMGQILCIPMILFGAWLMVRAVRRPPVTA